MGYRPNKGLLAARVILITGAGSGIGKACALAFAEHGARVILCGRTQVKLEQVYDQICQTEAPEPMLLPLNLAQIGMDDCTRVADAVMERCGILHGLLHNASMLGSLAPLSHYSAAEFDTVLKTNLTSVFQLTQALLPAMAQAPDASIVFTSSSVGRRARAYWGAYSVSKFGTEALMGIWADELENLGQIRCNSLNPGATRTPMRAQAYPAEDPATLPEAAELMPVYLYLMGPDSLGITGRQLDARTWHYAAEPGNPG